MYDRVRVCVCLTQGVHESQSLLWERCVGLSLPFAQYLLPLLKVNSQGVKNVSLNAYRMPIP